MKQTITLLCAASMLGGCYSMQGSERVLSRDARLTTAVRDDTIFFKDFQSAYNDRFNSGTVSEEKIDRVLSSGFTHIYSFCDNYFDSMGYQQRKSRVARDAIAPISALIAGVIAFHSFENNPGTKEDMLAVLGLATAASASALDIYDEHMLFGAENIGSVEKLTKAALNQHMTTVQRLDDISFDAATRHLLDNQAICSPQHILTLTREAIGEGRPAARAVDGEGGQGGDQRIEVSIDNLRTTGNGS